MRRHILPSIIAISPRRENISDFIFRLNISLSRLLLTSKKESRHGVGKKTFHVEQTQQNRYLEIYA